jgi:glycerol-3-phosphate dehydrogenase
MTVKISFGRKLTEIINQDHENLKYLPGHKLPENVVSAFCSVNRGSRRVIQL